MLQLQEQRKNPRREIRRSVRAVTVDESRASANCLLLDISESGARLHAGDGEALPDSFLLVLDKGIEKWCRVVRRTKTEVGVRFIKTQRIAHENRTKPRRAVRRAVQAVSVNDSHLAVDCQLLDISETGARLQSADIGAIPNEFVLVLRDDLQKWCRVVRRSRNEVGVRFVGRPSAPAAA